MKLRYFLILYIVLIGIIFYITDHVWSNVEDYYQISRQYYPHDIR